MALQVVQAARTQRISRRPKHQWNTIQRPWQIQPIVIAPVLPGETLKNALIQCRAVSKPVKNALVGWWAEHFFFYVKHRDLGISAQLQSMVLTPNYDPSALYSAADVKHYHQANSINYSLECLKVVTQHYFRDQGEAWNAALIDGLPVASINSTGWWDSIVDTTLMPEGSSTPGTAQTMESLDAMMDMYEFMRANKLMNMTYEDFLATYGVKKDAERERKPELLRFSREWSYPTNTVEPTTGTPTTALSWSIAERADKDRYFEEPGFIFGVQIFRPKVYMSNAKSSLAHNLDTAFSWLPALMRDDPYTSLREFANNRGPLAGTPTNGYWVDLRDLFLYGDQFINVAPSTTGLSNVAVPTAALVTRFASSTDADSLFSAASPANTIASDGVANFTILGTQQDFS